MGLDALMQILSGHEVVDPDEGTNVRPLRPEPPLPEPGLHRSQGVAPGPDRRRPRPHHPPVPRRAVVQPSRRHHRRRAKVVWKIAPLFASWAGSPSNALLASGVLSARSAVLELGCGVSALVGLALAPRVARYVLTDQANVARLVERNLEENAGLLLPPAKGAPSGARSRKGGGKAGSSGGGSSSASWRDRISFRPLDWESSAVHASLTGTPTLQSFDAVIACDCVYNEALIEPLAQTCVDVCRLRSREAAALAVSGAGAGAGSHPADGEEGEEAARPSARPCIALIAQQLRDPDVFQRWITRFLRDFRAWRIPDGQLPEELRSGNGFAVHVGVLRGVVDLQER